MPQGEVISAGLHLMDGRKSIHLHCWYALAVSRSLPRELPLFYLDNRYPPIDMQSGEGGRILGFSGDQSFPSLFASSE